MSGIKPEASRFNNPVASSAVVNLISLNNLLTNNYNISRCNNFIASCIRFRVPQTIQILQCFTPNVFVPNNFKHVNFYITTTIKDVSPPTVEGQVTVCFVQDLEINTDSNISCALSSCCQSSIRQS